MILYYAVGGGLGHLTRARAVVHSLGLNDELTILSASPFCSDHRVTGGANCIHIPSMLASNAEVYRGWLLDVLEALRPRLMFIDAFPGGLLGEFCSFPFPKGMQLYHVSRLLRWPLYRQRLAGELPFFEISFVVEPLIGTHRRAIERCSTDVVDLQLADPPADLSRHAISFVDELNPRGAPLWLVIHSGPPSEVASLCALARSQARLEGVRPRLLLISPGRQPTARVDLPLLPLYPATPLFERAQRLVTACGFNAMRQAAPLRSRHLFVPFDRSLDNQQMRASRHGAAPTRATDLGPAAPARVGSTHDERARSSPS